SSPVRSAKRPPLIPQCEMVGTSQPILARLFTTCAPSGALATRTMASAPPFRRRRSWGLMSGSPQLNFSNPTGWAPSWPNHLVRPSWLLAPHGVFSRMMPGFFLPSLSVTCLARKWSTMSSLAETRNMKLGFRPFRVIPVAAAQGPTYGTFSSWNTGSIARPTGEGIPPNTTTAFSRSMTSRAAVTPFPGLPSSSRMTSSILRPPSTPPLTLISSMATVSPRLIASPESAEPPDMAATSATTTGSLACCAGAMVAVSATASVRKKTMRGNPERRIEPPELRLPLRWAVTFRPGGETVARRPQAGARRRQERLHHDRIDPAAIEQALLFVDPHREEAVLVVERHAAGVVGERRQHELVEAVLSAQLDQPGEQRATHALAPVAALRVHGQVGDVTVR